MDSKGTNDPYIEITYLDENKRSKYIENSVNSVRKKLFIIN